MRIRTYLAAGMAAGFCVSVAQPAAATVFIGTGFSITDNSTHSSTINVGAAGLVSNTDFTLNGLTHTYIGDLSGALTHSGVTVSFLNHTGANADLNGNYRIIDGAASTLGNALSTPRPSGDYSAITPLSAFIGTSLAGAWTLTIADNANQDTGALSSWSLDLPRGRGAGFTIGDLSTHSSTVRLTDTGIVDNVSFSALGLQHSFVGDLIGTLSHGGVTLNWLNRQGGSLDLNGDYTFGSGGFQLLGFAGGNPQPSGLYLPDSPLSIFNGQSAAGDWVLTIADTAAQDVGSLDGWDLNVHTHLFVPPPPPPPLGGVPEPATWALMLGGFGLMGGALRSRRRVRMALG